MSGGRSAAGSPEARSRSGNPEEDSITKLEREREKALRAAADARLAEREVLEQHDRIRQLTRQLADAERRLDALRRRQAVRLALRLADGARALLDSVPSRRAAIRPSAERPPDAARWADGPRTFPGVDLDPRTLPGRYRDALLHALLGSVAATGRLRIVVVEGTQEASGEAGLAAAIHGSLAGHGFDVMVTGAAATAPDSVRNADVIVVTDPGFDPLIVPPGIIRIAWPPQRDAAAGGRRSAAGWPSAVIAEYDIVISTNGDPAGLFVDAVERWLRASRIAIRAPAGSIATASTWGDTYFARDLRAALRGAGWPSRIHFHDVWDDPAIGRDDVVLDLLGLYEARTWQGASHVLWQVSHPELASSELYENYDLVFVASDSFAAAMDELVEVPVRPLHQATDPQRFRPDPTGPAHELLFVGNWRTGRRILEDLLPTDHGLAVYGRGWTPDRLDPAYHAAESIPNDELDGYYAAAAIVLNDHWRGMQREGFLSNRLYDAAACGALVISDDVEGMAAEFDGGVIGYRDRRHLRELIDYYLAHPDERRSTSERARRAVLERHTFAHRAQQLVEAIEPILRRIRGTMG
jgi:glycosyltransferase involved in cell wall biosynthesis